MNKQTVICYMSKDWRVSFEDFGRIVLPLANEKEQGNQTQRVKVTIEEEPWVE